VRLWQFRAENSNAVGVIAENISKKVNVYKNGGDVGAYDNEYSVRAVISG